MGCPFGVGAVYRVNAALESEDIVRRRLVVVVRVNGTGNARARGREGRRWDKMVVSLQRVLVNAVDIGAYRLSAWNIYCKGGGGEGGDDVTDDC